MPQVQEPQTLFQATILIAHTVAQAAFQWAPALLESLTQSAAMSMLSFGSLSAPVTVSQAAAYLQQVSAPGAYNILVSYWQLFVVLSLVGSIGLIAIIVYCIIRMRQVRAFEIERFHASVHPVAAYDVPKTQLRWNRIKAEIASDDEQNWRLAILEADIMLNDLLDTQGYRGETMGEKMRDVDRAEFRTIDQAWEAHRVRNRIAHEGTHLLLNQREVRRVIDLYEQVFREFHFVD